MDKRLISAVGLGVASILALLYLKKDRRQPRFAGIEGGGTSFLIGIAEGRADNIILTHRVMVTSPQETLNQVCQWLNQQEFDTLGLACFGPIGLNSDSTTYGCILSTPKPQWSNFPIIQQPPHRFLSKNLKFKGKIGLNVDVGGACLAEYRLGNHQTKHSLVYVTVGTGVGIGVVTSNHILQGLIHTEGGHMSVARHPEDQFRGVCPFHQDCLEGLTTNNALAQSLDISKHDLPNIPDDHPIWDREAYYLGQMCKNITLMYSPEAIVLGGGIMQRKGLIQKVQRHFRSSLNKYLVHPTLESNNYIRPAKLEYPGLIGSILLGISA